MVLQTIQLVTSASMVFATLSLRALFFSNLQQAQASFERSQICFQFVDELFELESFFGNVHGEEEHEIFSKPLLNIRIHHFINDDHCEPFL